jgi:hypothetical protein
MATLALSILLLRHMPIQVSGGADLAGTDTDTCIRYADMLFPQKHQYGDTDTIFLIKIKT